MNFLELQNSVLTDRFSENKRAAAKDWINHRYGRIWAMAAWPFKMGTKTITLAQNSSIYTKDADMGRIVALWDSSIAPVQTDLAAIRPEDFFKFTSTVASFPVEFTVVGDSIIFERPASQSRTFTVLYEKKFVPLAADGETPLLPVEFHLALVSGAVSYGLKQENDPSWQGQEADFNDAINDLKTSYLVGVTSFTDSYPAWP